MLHRNEVPLPGVSIHISITKKFELAYKLIEEAYNVYAKLVRFDIRWKEVMSKDGFLLRSNIAWYRNVVEYLSQKELVPIVIIGTGLPKNVSGMIRIADSEKYLAELVYDYAYTISRILKPYVKMYQLGNELNHPLTSLSQRLRTRFIEELCRGVDDGVGDSIKILNVLIDIPGWKEFLSSFQILIKKCIDVIGVDHYPNTWTLVKDYGLEELKYLYKFSKLHGKQLAITEVGFASELRIFGRVVLRREIEQTKFINNLFKFLNVLTKHIPLNFILWYMLWDEDPITCEPFNGFGWCGWGVLRNDFSKKLSWSTLRKWFRDLASNSDQFILK